MLETAIRIAFDIFSLSFLVLMSTACISTIGLIGWMVIDCATYREDND